MNGSMVRASPGRVWRMRQWPNDPTVAHLIFVDHQHTPSGDDLAEAVDHARLRGARAVRTSALFPDAAERVLDAGFVAIDRLALLHRRTADDLPQQHHDTRPFQVWQHRAAAEVDRLAFGPMWGNDATSLRDIRRATPVHRARIVKVDGQLAGFAISGGASDNGYLQRVAVHPDHHRSGIARSLVIDAVRWMRSDHRGRCLVNTGTDNVPALALYEGLGFERLRDELVIAELRFPE